MKVYANPGSGSACVEALLAELELPYERILVKYNEHGIVDPEFRTINPRNQIPVLVLDDGRSLTETKAILLYLADQHPESQLAARSGTFARAKLEQWMSFVLANIYEGELRKNYPHRYVNGDWESVEEVATSFVMNNYAILEQACSDDLYFFGDRLSVLDIYLWMFINWFETVQEIRIACPKMVAIAERVMNRPKITAIHNQNFGPELGWSEVVV